MPYILPFIVIGLFGFAALAVCALLDFVKIANMTDEEFNKFIIKKKIKLIII